MASGEIRCAIHGFIEIDELEKSIMNTEAFQRLKHIHQLAMTYLVYPGATHTRFEHMLGAMHLAGRIIDRITKSHEESIKKHFDWNAERMRTLIRLAALLHDVGHAPFSHGVEEELFPKGKNHEWMSAQIVLSDEFKELIETKHKRFGIKASEIVYVMTGSSEYSGLETPRPELQFLSELITGALGVDRMDYLLRDSYHVGVQYGKFDLERLINTLGVIEYSSREGPQVGVEMGGLHAAESLLVARYWMFLQVYHHDVRRVYDWHLRNYMVEKYKQFPVENMKDYIRFSESMVLNDLMKDATGPASELQKLANRVYSRKHYRSVEPVFFRPQFFEKEVVPELESKIPEIKPLVEHKDVVYTDSPSPEVYKSKHFERLFVYNKDAHDRDNPRSVLDESELLWNITPITPCRIYVAPEAEAVREKVREICKPLKTKENKMIGEEREAKRRAANEQKK